MVLDVYEQNTQCVGQPETNQYHAPQIRLSLLTKWPNCSSTHTVFSGA